jgi:Ni/Co efflux regulator RcnB
MKRILIAATALTLLAAPFGAAFAQPDRHDDHHDNNTMMMDRHDDHKGNSMMMMNNMHHDWHKGGRIERTDWDRGERVSDWHGHHLSRPPHGYEWRRVDNNYVLAAVAGGLIASVIAASH